jgi:hypothetical protein
MNPQPKKTQRERLLDLLLSAHGAEVGLPQILSLQISQFGARLKELRALGFNIQNRQEHHGGQTHSFYRLVSGPTSTPAPALVPAPTPTDSQPPTLFDLGVPEGRTYRE